MKRFMNLTLVFMGLLLYGNNSMGGDFESRLKAAGSNLEAYRVLMSGANQDQLNQIRNVGRAKMTTPANKQAFDAAFNARQNELNQPQPTRATVPTIPTVPTLPTRPTVPTVPTVPTLPTRPTVPTGPTAAPTDEAGIRKLLKQIGDTRRQISAMIPAIQPVMLAQDVHDSVVAAVP